MFGHKIPEHRFNVQYPAVIERKTAIGVQTFKIHVQGNFIPQNGAPHFNADVITVDGIPDMNIRSFYPGEIKDLTVWTMKNVWPKLGSYIVK